jgi:hypothetical protein
VHFGASSSLLEPLNPSAGAGTAAPKAISLPPLLFDLAAEGGAELINLAEDPACAALTRDYAQKMLSWRMQNMERTLTHLIVSDHRGVYERSERGPARALEEPLPPARM